MATREEILNFSETIQKLSAQKKISAMDSIIDYCKETGLEIEIAATLITSSLKARIKEEAQSLNLLKKSSQLPI
jgi:hypothetical protein